MERRKFLVGVGSLAAGSAAAMGTGAFTSVEAERSMDVQVAGDASALLAIEPGTTGNGDYVDDSGDTVKIDLSQVDGTGFNQDALTKILDILKITNQGSQPVLVWVDGIPDDTEVHFAVSGGSFLNKTAPVTEDGVSIDQNKGALSTNSTIDASNPAGTGDGGAQGAPLLGPGDHIDVELWADGDSFDGNVTINAVNPGDL